MHLPVPPPSSADTTMQHRLKCVPPGKLEAEAGIKLDLCPCPGYENLASLVISLLEIRMATKHWIAVPFVALVLLWLDIKMPPFQVKVCLLIQLCGVPCVSLRFFTAKFIMMGTGSQDLTW